MSTDNLLIPSDHIELVTGLLTQLGAEVDPETPARMLKALRELTAGYQTTDLKALLKSFKSPNDDVGIVTVNEVPFASLCEHHVLPFTGTVSVAYVPADRIVGLSKIPRLIRAVTRRLQVQERIGATIADTIAEALNPLGVLVVVQARHTCMGLRGVESPGLMRTAAIRGVFKDEHDARAEAYKLLGL